MILHTLAAVVDGVLVLRRSGIIIEADAGACALLSVPRKRLAGSLLFPHLSPKDRAACRASWKQLRAKGTMDAVLHRTGKGTEERYLSLRCHTDRSTGLIIGTLRDTTEEHRIHAARQEAEHRYRMFIGNSSEGIWCFGLKRPMSTGLSVKEQITWFFRYGYLLECNDAYAAMYGFTKAEEIVGIMLKDVMDRKDPKNIAYLTAFITSGYRLRETETNEQDRHGRTFTVANNLTGTVVDGRLINAWGTQRDVTEKKLKDEALTHSKESYEGLIKRLPFVVYRWRRTVSGERRIEYVSPQVKELCGVSAEDLIAHQDRFLGMIHPDDRQVFLDRNVESVTTLEPFQHECRAALVGEERWLQFHSTPRVLENGDILWDGILRDVTERVLAQRALGSSEERYRSLIHNLNEGIWVIDAKAVTTMVNPRMAAIVGAPADAMIGRPLFDFIRKEDFERTNVSLERRKQGLRDSREYTFHRADGSRVHTTVETYPLIDSGGTYVGAVAAFTDVTEQREASAALQRQNEQLRFLAEASSRLAECSSESAVHDLIAAMITALIPRSYAFVLISAPDNTTCRLVSMGGVDPRMLAAGKRLLRFDPFRQSFGPMTEFAEKYCSPHLREFSGGLYEAANKYLPKFVARGIEKLTGARHCYSIGIAEGSSYIGYVFLLTAEPVDGNGSTLESFIHQCYLALTRFVSIRQMEQEALRRKTMMDILTDGVLIIDQEHRVVECNPGICGMLGYTAGELKQLHTWDFEAVMTEQQIRREFADLTKIRSTFETVHRRKDGSTVEVEVSANGTMIDGKNYVITVCRNITERKRMEQALRISEAQYRMLVNRIPQRVFVKDVRSNYVSCNESYAADLGLPADAIAGRNDFEFFPRELAEQYRADDRLVAGSRMPLEREESYILNGEEHIILTTKVPLFDESGAVNGILGIFGDITDRKRMENALRASEERFRAYLEHSPAIITIVDRTGVISYINRVEGEYTPDDFLGTNIFSTILPEHHTEVRQCLEETVRTRTVRSYTTSASVNGETWWYDNRVAVLNADGSEILITSINVTEQKRAEDARIAIEQEVRLSEESYRGLFNTVQDAIYIQDEQGVFIDVNEGAEAMYGYRREEMIGRTPEFVAASGRNDHLDFPVILRSVMRGANQQFEFWGRRKDGEIFPKDVRLSKGLYFGRPVIIALAQDISARKQMEQDRERQYEELRLLYALVRDIARDQTEAPIFRHAVEYLATGMRCPKASLLLFDAHGVMQFMDSIGLSDGYRTAAAGHTPWSADADDPQPIFVADVNDEPSLSALLPVILREGIRALGFIPLLHDGRLIGNFMVYHTEPHRFTDQESRLALTIAQIAAQAIARAKNAHKLQQNEEALQNIFESLEEGVALNELVYDDQGTIVDYRILEVNRAFESIAQLPRDRVIGRLATDIYQMPTEYITAFWEQHLHDTAAVKTDLYSELARSWKHVSTSIPKNGRFVTSFFDITEMKNTETALRTSEERYRTVANFTYDWEMWIDADETIQYISPSCERVCGYRPEEITADPALLTAMVHPDDRETVAHHRQDEFHKHDPHSLEYRIIHRSGEERWVNHICRPIVTDDGRALGRRISTRDITERKRHEEQIRWSEQRYRNIVENIHQAYYESDRFAIFTYCNPGMVILSGYTEDELLGKSSFRLVADEDRTFVKSMYRQWKDAKQQKMSLEFRVLLKSGAILWVEQTTHFEYDEQGNFKKAVNFAKDITERKRAADRLRLSEERNRVLIESMPDLIFVLDRQGRFVDFHAPKESLLLFPPAVFMGRTIPEVMPPEFVDIMMPKLEAAFATGAIQYYEYSLPVQQETKYFDARLILFGSDQVINIVRDITERKMSEEQLHASELRYRQITEAITDYIYTVTVEGHVVSATKHGPGCQAVTGYSVDEFERDRFLWNTMIVPEDRQMVEERIRAVLENRASQPVEHRIIRKDGVLRWVRNTLVPRYNSSGELHSYDGLIQDITERKTAEEGLRHSEARNRALVRTIPDIMFVQDGNGRFLDVHVPDTAGLLVPPELFIHRTLDDLLLLGETLGPRPFEIRSPDIPEPMRNSRELRALVNNIIRPKLRQALESGTMQEYQYSIITGEVKEHFEAKLIAFDEDKILHIIRNVTDKVVYENTLRMMNEELEERVARRTRQLTEANRELEAFSYSVSHDLRAPLRAIDSFSAMLVEGYADRFDDEGRRLITVVRSSIKKMDQLINGLLTLSRIGRDELHLVRVEMGTLVRDVLQEHLSDEQRGRYSVIIGKLPACRADATLVRQAVANLITNAVKYSATVDAPVIVISGRQEEGSVRYSVKDNGVGFDTSNANKLFGIFQRLHTDDQFKGLGIGLSIVQRIVHRHGGQVSAEGILNGGATFSFTLPVAGDTAEPGQ